MAKRYTDQLAEWVKKRDATRRRQDKNVVAFLSVRADVKEAMGAGYALKTIWAHMHELGKIPYRYETFLKHVRRHIKEAKPAPPPAPRQAGIEKGDHGKGNTPDAREPCRPAKDKLEGSTGFTFEAQPNREDLI